jgi:uncharacterized protein YigA (DUF484 family)
MTDVSTPENLALDLTQSNKDDVVALDDSDVRTFLQANPDFFLRNGDLLEKLAVPHATRGSVSLVDVQSDQLKKRVRQLSQKLNQLISVAKQNEKIYRVYVALNLKLMQCKNFADVQNTLEEVMLEQLNLASVHIKPFSGALALPELQQRLFIEKRFRSGKFFFGRLGQHEKQLLFADDVAESAALVLIGDDKPIAILAVGSKDAGHFAPNMDTLLLRQLQQMLNILLGDFLEY